MKRKKKRIKLSALQWLDRVNLVYEQKLRKADKTRDKVLIPLDKWYRTISEPVFHKHETKIKRISDEYKYQIKVINRKLRNAASRVRRKVS